MMTRRSLIAAFAVLTLAGCSAQKSAETTAMTASSDSLLAASPIEPAQGQLQPQSDFQPQTPPAETPLFRIGRLRNQDARLDYRDQSRPTEFRTLLGPLRIDLRDFGNDRDSKNPYAFAGRTESGETFSWSGFFYVDTIRSGVQFTLGNVQLNIYHPYYQDSVLFYIKEG